MIRVAAVQFPPVYYDLESSLQRAVEIVEAAAKLDIQCLVFPEAWLTGYPMLAWEIAPENDFGPFSAVYQRMYDSAANLSRDDLKPLCDAAKEHRMVVVMGLNEQASEMAAGTIYNTVVTIDANGEILNTHRKVMPTNPERMIWGFGDGRGLNVVETAAGRVGCLLCWENFMPLARTAIYAQNVEIFCAPTADASDNWNATMRHIGREGSCFVISVSSTLEANDIPDDLPPHKPNKRAKGWVVPGNGIICGPLGDVLAGPMLEEKGFLQTSIDLDQVRQARRSFDVVGHYSRPDIFHLSVDRSAKAPVNLTET